MNVYFDNAATTPTLPEVVDVMLPYFSQTFGNPSSIHSHGRETRSAIEKARKSVANVLGTSPSQLFFTSGATESNNMILNGAVQSLGCKHIITSAIEHHAVLHTAQNLATDGIKVHFVKLNQDGEIELEHLETLLKIYPNAIVSLMHGNNEVGNILDLQQVGTLAKKYNAYFHSDTVQTIGYYDFDLKNLPIDFLVGSAHKFHGPKGVGFVHINEGIKLPAFIHGGSQERNMRGGTENVPAIVGLAKAIEISAVKRSTNNLKIKALKKYFIDSLQNIVPNIGFNGMSGNPEKSLSHIINVAFPKTEIDEMLLFNFDIHKISVSGGSACTSGALAGSHVLHAIYGDADERQSVRFSFSSFNTTSEIDYVMEVIKKLFG
ncbi:MAG: cysteine desulfurase [Bacteroidetes bacterium]|nr:MAG: cysteine desulfurase [Bacteroidota bacterium]